jgi:hypothetical protein
MSGETMPYFDTDSGSSDALTATKTQHFAFSANDTRCDIGSPQLELETDRAGLRAFGIPSPLIKARAPALINAHQR